MTTSSLEDKHTKDLMKQALLELFEERRDLFYELFKELFEDVVPVVGDLEDFCAGALASAFELFLDIGGRGDFAEFADMWNYVRGLYLFWRVTLADYAIIIASEAETGDTWAGATETLVDWGFLNTDDGQHGEPAAWVKKQIKQLNQWGAN